MSEAWNHLSSPLAENEPLADDLQLENVSNAFFYDVNVMDYMQGNNFNLRVLAAQGNNFNLNIFQYENANELEGQVPADPEDNPQPTAYINEPVHQGHVDYVEMNAQVEHDLPNEITINTSINENTTTNTSINEYTTTNTSINEYTTTNTSINENTQINTSINENTQINGVPPQPYPMGWLASSARVPLTTQNYAAEERALQAFDYAYYQLVPQPGLNGLLQEPISMARRTCEASRRYRINPADAAVYAAWSFATWSLARKPDSKLSDPDRSRLKQHRVAVGRALIASGAVVFTTPQEDVLAVQVTMHDETPPPETWTPAMQNVQVPELMDAADFDEGEDVDENEALVLPAAKRARTM